MAVFDRLEGHEEVVFFADPSSGLRAIVAIHSSVLGPARGYQPERAKASVEGVYRTLREVFGVARQSGISTADAADRFAEERIERIGRVRRYWVPGR